MARPTHAHSANVLFAVGTIALSLSLGPASTGQEPAVAGSRPDEVRTVEALERAITGRTLGGELAGLRAALQTSEGAQRGAEVLRRGVGAEALDALEHAIRGVNVPDATLPTFAECATTATDIRHRGLALDVLGMRAPFPAAAVARDTLSRVAADPAEATELRVRAIAALGSNQRYAREPVLGRAHADLMRRTVASTAPAEVRAQAARRMFGVGYIPSLRVGREDDADFVMRCIEHDAEPLVRAAAMRALPFRWRAGYAEDVPRFARVTRLARDPAEPGIVRLAAIYCAVSSSFGEPGGGPRGQPPLLQVSRELLARGIDMPCWSCQRLLSARDGCKDCRWWKPVPPETVPPSRK